MEHPPSPIRVLLVDDHEIVRQGLSLLLAHQPDMQVVGEAASGREAIALALQIYPDVVVLDISMPDVNGVEAARTLRDVATGCAVVTLTRHTDYAYVEQLAAAGAIGYVLKQSPSAELLLAIRAAVEGRRYLDSALERRRTARRGGASGRIARPPTVSQREGEVLRLVAAGQSNKEIATLLAISVKTVEVHKSSAMRKLDLHGRVDVIRYALQQQWLQDP